MKVLIVEKLVSNQFQLVEELQNQLQINNNNILIADNGLDACVVTEKFNPDLILMGIDLPVVDGLNATKSIVAKHPNIKIVMLANSEDSFLAQLSKNVGAKAFLSKDNVAQKIKLIVEQLDENKTVFLPDQSPKALISSQNDSVLERPNKALKIKTIITAKIIEQWIYGREVIQLREHEFLDCFDTLPNDREGMLNKILQGDTVNCNLLEELNLRFENLASKQLRGLDCEQIEARLEEVTTQIENWFYQDNGKIFSCFQTRLEINAQELCINFSQQLKNFATIFFLKVQPLPCLKYLEGIEMILKSIILNNYEELERLKNQEKSAIRAYKKLIQSDDNPQKVEALLRAILIEYQAKIQIEAINLVIHCIRSLIRNINFYIDDLIQVNNLLANAQDYLKTSSIDPMLSSFIEQKFCSLQDPIDLLREIEREIGYSINHWGRQYHINPNFILEIILGKVSGYSQQILEIMNDF